MAFTIITQGSFTSAGVPVNLNMPSSVDYFKTMNLTQLATTATPGVGFEFEFYPNFMAQNSAIEWKKSDGTNVANMVLVTSGGFNYFNKYPDPEPAVTGTAITAANPAVVSMTNTYNNGDRVVLYDTTGMLQISGMIFTISSVSGSAFSLLGLNASGFSAAATNVIARRIAPFDRVEPEFYYVTAVSQATQAVVTVSQAHNYVVGQKVEFTIPSSFGMVQLNNFYQPQSLPAVIVALGSGSQAAYQFIINVNTSAYTAFAFPASSGSPTTTLFATVAPAGQSTQFNPNTGVQTGYDFQKVPFRSGLFIPYINLQAGAQSPAGQNADVIVWQAFKMENGYPF